MDIVKMMRTFGDAELFILCLGLGLMTTGYVSVSKGKTWIKGNGLWNVEIVWRSENPRLFWAITILMYWVCGFFLCIAPFIAAARQIGYLGP